MASITVEPFENKVIAKKRDNNKNLRAMTLNIDEQKFRIGWFKWKSGYSIREAFPMLNQDERNFILVELPEEDWNEFLEGKDM